MKIWMLGLWLACVVLMGAGLSVAQGIDLCPTESFADTPDFPAEGYLLTSFDASALWVYDLGQASRYPLPETRPCTSNCRLSPDGTWLSYPDPNSLAFFKMRVNGTQRTQIAVGATDVEWWAEGMWLLWTPDQRAFLQAEGNNDENARELLSAGGIVSIQPNGRWGVALERLPNGEIVRTLVNLAQQGLPEQARVRLAPDVPYASALAWSADGTWLAYVGRGALDPATQAQGSELFLLRAGDILPQQVSFFSAQQGAVRLGGYAVNSLFWSPDQRKVAFWVMPLRGANPETEADAAQIHILDVETRQIVRYCGFSTSEHTPNPPRLAWSPSSEALAFGVNVPNDNKGYLLLALNVQTGVFSEISEGIFPALGVADVVAWGRLP